MSFVHKCNKNIIYDIKRDEFAWHNKILTNRLRFICLFGQILRYGNNFKRSGGLMAHSVVRYLWLVTINNVRFRITSKSSRHVSSLLNERGCYQRVQILQYTLVCYPLQKGYLTTLYWVVKSMGLTEIGGPYLKYLEVIMKIWVQ